MAFIPEDKETIKSLIDCKPEENICVPIYIYSGGKRYTLPEINRVDTLSSNTLIGFGTRYSSSGVGLATNVKFPIEEFNKFFSIEDMIIEENGQYADSVNYILWSFQSIDYAEDCNNDTMQKLMNEMKSYTDQITEIIAKNIEKKRQQAIRDFEERNTKAAIEFSDDDTDIDLDDDLNM